MFSSPANFKLGAPFGIPLEVDRILVVLVGIFAVYGLAIGQLAQALIYPLVYASIYVHELGHALATVAVGGRVTRIVLLFFGGLTYPEGIRGTGRSVIVSAAGPAVSIALGFLLRAVSEGVEGWPGALLSNVGWLNVFWGLLNLIPIFPLDGGQILNTLVIDRLGQASGAALTARVSLVSIGISFVVMMSAWQPSLFLILLLGYLGYINVQLYRQARQAGARGGLFESLTGGARGGRSKGSGPRPAPRPARARVSIPEPEGNAEFLRMRSRAANFGQMQALLQRGVKVGLGGLSPEDRRLILFHRTMLETELTMGGFDSLSAAQRELLALHHEMEDRESH